MPKDIYASLKQGLVGCWIPSISGSGLTLPDVSQYGNHGSLVGMDASDWVSSGSGRALDFDGSNDYVELDFKDNLQDLTISTWFYRKATAASSNSGIVAKYIGNPSASRSWQVFYQQTTNYYGFTISTDGTFQAANDLISTTVSRQGQWDHVVARYSPSKLQDIFVNGVKIAEKSGSVAASIFSSSQKVRLATTFYTTIQADTLATGQLDDIRIYNRALTESEILLLSSDRGIGFKRNTSAFATRYAYKPPKPRNYGVIRNRDADTSSLKQGLVGAWCPSLPNGGSGNMLPDVSGYGNHGTLTNMAADDWVSSQYGRALDFDGTDDNVIANTSIVLKKTEGFTITAWVYRNAANAKGTFFKSGSIASNSGYGLAVGNANNADQNGDTLNFLFEGSAWVSTGATMSAQRWDHVSFVMSPISGGTAIAYLNGVEVKRETRGVDPTTTTLYIGGYNLAAFSLNRHFAGAIDDVRAYSRVLSESEIRILASRPGIGLQNPQDDYLYYQFPSGSKRRRLLTGMP